MQAEEVMSAKDVVITEAMMDAGVEARNGTYQKTDNLVAAIYTAMHNAKSDTAPASSVPTVRVRIAVAVDYEGGWNGEGRSADYRHSDAAIQSSVSRQGLGEGLTFHWIEADVPIPQRKVVTVIEGLVS